MPIRPEIPPVLSELLDLLPQPDSEWPLAERAKWLRAMAAAFDVVYTTTGPPRSIALYYNGRSQ